MQQHIEGLPLRGPQAQDPSAEANVGMCISLARSLQPRTRLIAGRQRGVTLVEVLIVVAIMAMLAGGVAFALLPQFQKASIKSARENAIKLRQVVALWRTDTPGECPTVSRLKKDKLLDKVGGDDPWGKPYTIRCSDGEVYVESMGPDQRAGTEDDITVPSEKENTEEE
jgi:general secretion pathway protein G